MIKRPVVRAIISGLLNLAVCIVAILIILIRKDFFGKNDTYAFLFWMLSLAVGLAISGEAFLKVVLINSNLFRILLILFTSALIASGWFYIVYFFLGSWMGAFDFPVFYLWIIGNAAQLLFLDWCLPKPIVKEEGTGLLLRSVLFFLAVPVTAVLTLILLFGISNANYYINRPEKELFLIPARFEGVFRIVYGKECGIEPEYENERRVLKIPEDGILVIKPKFKEGTLDHEYYLIDERGNRRKLDRTYDWGDNKPGVLSRGTGSIGGAMPDGSLSSESPLATHYSDYVLIVKDTTLFDLYRYEFLSRRVDSLLDVKLARCK
jgi:hypothetical protein